MGWLKTTSRRSMDRISTAAVTALWKISAKLNRRVELQAYANGLVNGLVVGFSVGIGRIWGFDVCVSTPLTVTWTLCQAQSTSLRLQHCDGARRLSMPCLTHEVGGHEKRVRSSQGLSQQHGK